MPDFKSIIGKLNVFKDNSALLLAIIIGVVAGLIFIPTQLLSGKLKKQITQKSISMGTRIRAESESVPARDQWKKVKELLQVYENDANQAERLAEQTTRRELLSYKIFPEPKDPSVLIFKEFGQGFRSSIEEMLVRVNARECPTDTDVERALQRSLSRPGSEGESLMRTSTLPSMTGRYGRPSGVMSKVQSTIIDEICLHRAQSAGLYTNPPSLSGYEFWGEYKYADTGRKESVEACWYYQLACWVIEDVIDTIRAMNSGSNGVLTSPVKRLMHVGFTVGGGTYGNYRGFGSEEVTQAYNTDRPSYVLTTGGELTEPCTGRYCNEDIDVIHFNVVAIVGTKAVLPFMKELCSEKQHKFKGFSGDEQERSFKHNQITILESQIRPVNREDQTHAFYRYGDEAVVELDLICEYIFNKKGYDEIKPESVKTTLKGEAQTEEQ